MKRPDSLRRYWKVPRREVYCETFRQWFKETLYCHVWLRLHPPKLPFLRLSLLITLLFWFTGCTATGTNGQPPTPQQIQTAQQINAGLAFGARLAYSVAVVEFAKQHSAKLAKLTDPVAIDRENTAYKKITDAESLVPPLLEQLDAAAKGDPTSFSYLLSEEGARIADIYLFGGGKP